MISKLHEVAFSRASRTILFFCLFVFAAAGTSRAEKPGRVEFLYAVELKIQRLLEEALADEQRFDEEIRKCTALMRQGEEFMQRGQALKSGQLEAKGVEILTKARQAKRKNEAAKSNAELRKKRAQEALRVVGEIRVKESPAGEPKLICSVLMEAWKKDPSMKGYFERKECTCVTANRPPVCGDKGMKYPEPEEKASGFYYVFSYLTDGHAMVREGNCFRTNKVYDEALEQCKEEVKGLLDPTEHFISPPIFIPW